MFFKKISNRGLIVWITVSFIIGFLLFSQFSAVYVYAQISEGDGLNGTGQPIIGGTTGTSFSEGNGINGQGAEGVTAPGANTTSGTSGGGSFSEGNGVNGTGQPTSGTPGGSGSSVGGSGSSVGGSGSSVTNTGFTKLINPLKFATLEAFLLAVIDVLLTFALPVIIFFIMYAGYLFVTAAGNEGQISTAKSALLWAVIGGVVILGAKLIITVIQGTVTAFGV